MPAEAEKWPKAEPPEAAHAPSVGSGPVGQTASMTGYAGAVVVLFSWALGQWHLTVPPEVSAALVMLLTPIVHLVALKIGALEKPTSPAKA